MHDVSWSWTCQHAAWEQLQADSTTDSALLDASLCLLKSLLSMLSGQNQGMMGQNTGVTGQHESLGQRVEEKLPGSTAYGSNQVCHYSPLRAHIM